MFSKPFKVKSNSQLKGSERKKIRIEIIKHFPTLSEDDVSTLLPPKETITSTRLYTSSGESVVVYSVPKFPLMFELEKVLYPTIYMMWQFPDAIPAFSTWPQVVPKIMGGADLMLPGVVLNSKSSINITSYGQLKKGDRLAVNLTSNKAAVAVGQAALASDDMYMAARRGKAVKILHYLGDHLWSLGTEKMLPELGPPKDLDLSEYEHENGLGVAATSQPETETTPSPSNSSLLEEKNPSKETLSVDSLSLSDGKESGKSETELLEEHRAEMDATVLFCFLKALRNLPKTVEYPLLVSTFYKLYMIPACPPDQTLDLKRSSHKKLSKFLQAMYAEGILLVRELTKGVESIISINMCHDLVRDFVDTTPKVVTEEPAAAPSPKISEMYGVTAAVLPLLSEFGFRKGALLSGPDVRKYLTIYVKDHRLQNAQDPSHVILDTVLRNATRSPPATVQAPWVDLGSSVLGSMTASLQVTRIAPGVAGAASFPGQQKGKVEPIDILVGSRSGNKKVTLVYNLELFGINLSEFAHTCQHGVAASTSISQAPNRKGQQVLIQGNQVYFVGKLLQDKYEIPKRYIRGLEKAIRPK